MSITPLKQRSSTEIHENARKAYSSLSSLLAELGGMDLKNDVVEEVNQKAAQINNADLTHRKAKSQIVKTRHSIIKMLEKRLKIVPKNYYRNLWMVLGMSAMGLPFGVAFGAALDNMAFMAIGIPIGMSIGMAIGAGMDEKAKKEGRQLSFEVEM